MFVRGPEEREPDTTYRRRHEPEELLDAYLACLLYTSKEIGAAILKAVYVVDARSDTLYNYLYEAGEYGVEVYGSFIRSYPPCDA